MMNKSLLIFVLAFCIAPTFAGIVVHTRCGGVGSCRTVRCDNCEGPLCYVTPGMPKSCSVDMIPSSAASYLRLRLTAVYLGYAIDIINTILEGSSVQPGFLYTIAYAITPNDLMSGNTIRLEAELSNYENDLVECCVAIQVHIY